MISDYRLDPFTGQINIREITGEEHTIPSNSPYTIRLDEVPYKSDPSTIRVTFKDSGAQLTEVAAQPAAGQYWPDYLTTAHGIEGWNTGTLLFNAADAGKTVLVSYQGMGTLVDTRAPEFLEVDVTGSTQPQREAIVASITSASDGKVTTPGGGDFTNSRGRIQTVPGVSAGTYTLKAVLQDLINKSHTHKYMTDTYHTNCNCNCNNTC